MPRQPPRLTATNHHDKLVQHRQEEEEERPPDGPEERAKVEARVLAAAPHLEVGSELGRLEPVGADIARDKLVCREVAGVSDGAGRGREDNGVCARAGQELEETFVSSGGCQRTKKTRTKPPD